MGTKVYTLKQELQTPVPKAYQWVKEKSGCKKMCAGLVLLQAVTHQVFNYFLAHDADHTELIGKMGL